MPLALYPTVLSFFLPETLQISMNEYPYTCAVIYRKETNSRVLVLYDQQDLKKRERKKGKARVVRLMFGPSQVCTLFSKRAPPNENLHEYYPLNARALV